MDVPTTPPSTVSVAVDPAYTAILGDSTNGWDDGVLTPDEIAQDPEALALITEFKSSIAAQLGAKLSTDAHRWALLTCLYLYRQEFPPATSMSTPSQLLEGEGCKGRVMHLTLLRR
jgi:hypothetical protein